MQGGGHGFESRILHLEDQGVISSYPSYLSYTLSKRFHRGSHEPEIAAPGKFETEKICFHGLGMTTQSVDLVSYSASNFADSATLLHDSNNMALILEMLEME